MDKKKSEILAVPGWNLHIKVLLNLKLPGFGFYPDTSIWSIFSPMRRVEGGNHSDEEVCDMLGIYWQMEREGVEQVEVECPPHWVY